MEEMTPGWSTTRKLIRNGLLGNAPTVCRATEIEPTLCEW
jgi:hypothetical protein